MKKIQSKVKVFAKRGLFLATLFCLLFATATLFPISSSEQSAKAISDTEQSYLTLDFTTTTASAYLKEQSIDGTFIESSDINFSITTDHYSGYKLLVSADDDLGRMISDGSIISSISTELTKTQFDNKKYNNLWGLKYNETYLPSPTTTATTLDNITSSGTNEYNIAFGARINYETPNGNYSKSLTLAAITNPIPDDVIMQNYTYERCQAEATDDNSTLVDIRDGKTYTVRYIDGVCWMTQNLAYDLKTNNTLSPETSNVSAATTLSTMNDLSGSSHSYTIAQTHAPTVEDLAQSGMSESATGYWYNYCAATAGEICTGLRYDDDDPLNTQEATQSVCPAGWRLPTYDEQSGITGAKKRFLLLPVYGGYWHSGTLDGASTSGYWWSSTAGDESNNRYTLHYYDGVLETYDGGSRFNGYYVRCVLEKPTMQNYTNEKCATEAADEPVTLYDERDDKSYTVRYINDSCWMTQNLAYDLKTNNTLSPETSNVNTKTTIATVGDLTSGNTYTEARIHIPTEKNLTSTELTAEANGYWYNYCAATAGERCEEVGSDCEEEATIDICPANWKMPSDEEWNNIGGDGSYSKTYVDQFSPVAAGYWISGRLDGAPSIGYWWSTTAYRDYRYYLYYRPSSGLYSGNYDGRRLGLSVRCMLTN